jgi:hypothetical protein
VFLPYQVKVQSSQQSWREKTKEKEIGGLAGGQAKRTNENSYVKSKIVVVLRK